MGKKSKTVTERVFQELRAKILNGEYQPGRSFNIDQIKRDLGVSNTPVREAMTRLERLGLVEIVPYSGPRIRQLDQSQVIDICDVRDTLEELAVRSIVQQQNPDVLKEMASALEEHRVACEAGDAEKAMVADRSFHAAMVHAAGNSVLSEMLPGLSDRTAMVISMSTSLLKGLPEASRLRAFQSHKRIYRTLQEGDEEAAVQALRYHLGKVRERLLASVPTPGGN